MAATTKKKRTRRVNPTVKVPRDVFTRVEQYLRRQVEESKDVDAALLLGALGTVSIDAGAAAQRETPAEEPTSAPVGGFGA